MRMALLGLIVLLAWSAQAADIFAEQGKIFIVGKIVDGDAERFKSVVIEHIKERRKNVPDINPSAFVSEGVRQFKAYHDGGIEVHTYSPGGSASEASEIGLLIQQLQIKTVAPEISSLSKHPKTALRTCALPADVARRDKGFERVNKWQCQYGEHPIFGAIRPDQRKYLCSGIKRRRVSRKRRPRPPYYRPYTYDPKTGEGDPNCVCASACFFIWAAGVERAGNSVLVHRPYFTRDQYRKMGVHEARSKTKLLYDQSRAYLKSLGVSDTLIDKMFATSSQSGHALTSAELEPLSIDPTFEELIIGHCGTASDWQSVTIKHKAAKGGKMTFSPIERRFHCEFMQRGKIILEAQDQFLAQYDTPPP